MLPATQGASKLHRTAALYPLRAMTPHHNAHRFNSLPLAGLYYAPSVRISVHRLMAGACYESFTQETLSLRLSPPTTQPSMRYSLANKGKSRVFTATSPSAAPSGRSPERTTLQRLETFFLARRAAVRAEKLSDSA
jgi:hypothetical protein